MDRDLISRRQSAAVLFVCLLSPLMRVAPRMPAGLAGRAAWLSALPAMAALLILGALLSCLRRQMLPGEGAAALFLRLWGPVCGRAALLLYGGWLLFYAGFVLRSGAARLTAAVYQQSGTEPFFIVMLALCLLFSLGRLRAMARMAVLLRVLMLASLVFVSLFALSNLRAEQLLPRGGRELVTALPGAVPLLTAGAPAALLLFLEGYAAPAPKQDGGTGRAFALFCAAAALLCFETVGTFGPVLTARLSYPYFTMVRDVSLFGLHQRIEAAVIVSWVLTDLMLCVMLLRCAHEALRAVFCLPAPEDAPLLRMGQGRWLLWLEAGVVFGLSFLLPPSAQGLQLWSRVYVPLITDCLVFGGLPLLLLTGALRGKLQ